MTWCAMLCPHFTVKNSGRGKWDIREILSIPQENVHNGHGKAGYIKAEQFYYFDRASIDFYVIGNVVPELFNALIAFINGLSEIEHIIDNL